MTYTTPDTAHVPLRVVAFERQPDGSPSFTEFYARKVSVSPKSTLYQRTDADGNDVPGLEVVERGDVFTEEPLATLR